MKNATVTRIQITSCISSPKPIPPARWPSPRPRRLRSEPPDEAEPGRRLLDLQHANRIHQKICPLRKIAPPLVEHHDSRSELVLARNRDFLQRLRRPAEKP